MTKPNSKRRGISIMAMIREAIGKLPKADIARCEEAPIGRNCLICRSYPTDKIVEDEMNKHIKKKNKKKTYLFDRARGRHCALLQHALLAHPGEARRRLESC